MATGTSRSSVPCSRWMGQETPSTRRGEAGRGAGLHSNSEDSVQASPHPNPPPVGEGITVSVQDNGIGFPDGDAGKMIEPYVTTRSSGTGLGLAIVKKIVDDHNGLLSLENNPDCGAKVTLSF